MTKPGKQTHMLDEQKAGTEIAPGIMIERRFFLSASAVATAASLVLGDSQRSFALPTNDNREKDGTVPGTEPGEISWDEFISQTVPEAQQLLKQAVPNLDHYLYRIAAAASRLRKVPETKLYPLGKLRPPITLAPSYKGPPFVVIQWRMAPGAVFPPHNHPHYSVCTLALEGRARIRNYEIVGEAPAFDSKKTFQVRETHNEILEPGRINTLSPTRDNIHRFQAGKEGARGIDITTLHGDDIGFSYIDIEDRSRDSEGRIFEAAWKGTEV